MLLYVDSNFLSPYAMSVFVALRTKRIEFQLKTINLHAQQNLRHEYVQTSLTSRVPTLIDGEFSLSESSAITEYLEELKPFPCLYPKNIQDRARARQIQAWLRSDLFALRQEFTTETIFHKKLNKKLTIQAKKDSEKLIRFASFLLSNNRISLFDYWCIADTDLVLMLNRLIFNGYEVPEVLIQYAKNQWENSAIQEWVQIERPSILM
jgi:glutathione S-transferase